ncbi:hypothetical protein AS026_03105 [Rhizobium altiplani]|uniref:Uncharacterized protein n=1 Tax=Rhizobium altiplani TaxID=1864509 RepID=A0A109JRM3_9HYPH|nr:hypothetical protein AS026_03105 [Rhizobium altiplani]
MGLIAMSERDLQRIEILSKVNDGRMTLVSAAHVLDLSERQVERMRTGGMATVRQTRSLAARPARLLRGLGVWELPGPA